MKIRRPFPELDFSRTFFLRAFALPVWTLFFLLGVITVSVPASAQPPHAARLSPQDRLQISRIESYFNNLNSIKSRFLQIASDGTFAEGKLYLSRPGLLRMEYDPPVPILLISDGTWLIYVDKKLQQISHVPIGSTPAGILVKDKVSFSSGDLTITNFEQGANVLRLTLAKAKDPLEGSITLTFNDRPLIFKKWTVIDAQGIVTTVSLTETRFDVPVNKDLFQFTPDWEQEKTD
ncbi:MAG: outer membrane lipoprotein carrier protein LolA [Rhodospirillales bacterium]|nr:outer membrane lipoprotein carrier protein LolA [Rhodospirillales bacterium]